MVTTDVELELAQQLKEAGKRLSNPPDSIEDLLYVLDQTDKLLQKVDQSPNSLMQEALNQPMKVLVNETLLEHSNVDVKVSVASCICEITRITAPDAPYTDEEMKTIFKCIVSSFDNLSDETSRSYGKRASILDTVCKVRSCVIMLDLECDELILRMFEHFLNSVRDHHLDKMFSWMSNIMALVIEENEDISLDLLRPLMASIKNNNEGILPVARKLGEEVIKKSADKLRPFIDQILTILGGSLDDYSQVLTSIIKGTTDVHENNDESAPVQPKVTSNGKMVTENEAGSDDKESKKSVEAVDHQPEEVADHPNSNLTSKLDINESVAEVENVESNQQTTSTMQSTEPCDNKTEKLTDILFSVKKGIRSKKKIPTQTDAPSTDIGLTKALENTSDSEMKSPKRARRKTPKVDDNKPLATRDSDDKLLKKSTKKVVIVDLGSKKKGSSQTDAPSTDIGLIKAPEITSDTEVKSKRARKKTPKAVDYKTSATSGSDAEISKRSTKKANTVDSASKKKGSSQTDAPSTDIGLIKSPEITSDTEVKSPKRARKKTPTAVDYKTSVTSGSDVEISKKSAKKADTVDSGSKKKSSSQTDATEEVSDSGMKSPKRVRKKTPKAEDNKPSTTSDSDDKLLKKSTKKVDSGSKPVKRSGKKVGGGDSVAKKRKLSGKKESELKKPKLDDKKVCAGDSEVKLTDQSLMKDNVSDSDAKPLKKLSGKKTVRNKTITKPSEDIIAHKDVETDSDDKTETDSDNQPISLSAKKSNKSSSSMVKSSSKNKAGKKQAESLSEDDGMDVLLKSALKSAKKEGKLEETLSTTSKRKRSVGKKKVIESVKYDDSLVGEKVKVWWPKDKIYYEGVIKSFDAAKNKHKVLYLDNQIEYLVLKKEKWEIIKEHSEAQSTDIRSETAGESKADDKSKDTKEGDDKVSKSVAKNKTEKIVYKSRGKKGKNIKTKSVDAKSPENVKESEAEEAVEGEESEKKA